TSSSFIVHIVYGGSDLPSRIDDPALIADRTITVPVNFVFSSPLPRVLDWNGDGFADVLVVTPAAESLPNEIGVVYSGKAIKESQTQSVNESAARLLSSLPETAVGTDEMALLYGPNWQSLGLTFSTASFSRRGGTPTV